MNVAHSCGLVYLWQQFSALWTSVSVDFNVFYVTGYVVVTSAVSTWTLCCSKQSLISKVFNFVIIYIGSKLCTGGKVRYLWFCFRWSEQTRWRTWISTNQTMSLRSMSGRGRRGFARRLWCCEMPALQVGIAAAVLYASDFDRDWILSAVFDQWRSAVYQTGHAPVELTWKHVVVMDMPWLNFSLTPELGKSSRVKYPCFGDTWKSL